MFADLTPSASGESEVSKHSTPIHQPPKIKVKIKVKTISGYPVSKGAG
jgi:hypothetical protein